MRDMAKMATDGALVEIQYCALSLADYCFLKAVRIVFNYRHGIARYRDPSRVREPPG